MKPFRCPKCGKRVVRLNVGTDVTRVFDAKPKLLFVRNIFDPDLAMEQRPVFSLHRHVKAVHRG